MFRRSRPYDRTVALAAAARAEGKGRLKRAIAEYRKVLDNEPEDYAVRGRLAPLLARKGQLDAAWTHFMAAVDGYLEEGFSEKALGVLRQAARCFPDRPLLWERMADLHVRLEHPADALRTLHDGAAHLRGRSSRQDGIRLLQKAHHLAPDDVETCLELARRLAKARRRDEACGLLDRLVDGLEGPELRAVRRRLFLIRPTPARAWHWIRAVRRDE